MVYTIDDLRRIIAPIAEQYGLRAVYVFGSYARGEANADSDIDLLVRYATTPGIFEFVSLKQYLEESLGRPVDLVTEGALKKRMRSVILQEAVRVYSSAV